MSTTEVYPLRDPNLDRGCPSIPFYIGVTGHMDLETGDRAKVEQTLQALFDWLRGDDPKGKRFPGPGLGLKHTPLVVLSSLAPGADHWVAEFASQPDALSDGKPRARVLAPLPFLPDQYVRASTFQTTPSKAPPHDADQTARDRYDRHAQQREQSVAAARAFLQGQPAENLFLVRLPDEVKRSDVQLRADHEDFELLAGKDRKPERDRRYGAAGEYVAAYSDLLLVLADPLDRTNVERERREHPKPGLPDVGTHGIADVRRRGLTPGQLPIRPALSWADSGPVLRIAAFRRKTGAAEAQRAGAGEAEWLFPLDSRPPEMDPQDDANDDWQARGLEELRRFARNLDDFNLDRLPPGQTQRQDPDEEWHHMLSPEDADAPALSRQPAAGEAPAVGVLRGELHRIGRMRRWAATLNDHHDKGVRFLRGWLFLTALGAALSLALYEQWQYPPVPAAAEPHAAETFTVWRWAFFGGSLVLTLLAFELMRQFRGEARDRKRTDYRAVAEGLRVQFFWTAAGTGQSVSSACLQRQRGELTWIRAAIASAAFPYERAAVAFASLPGRTQHALLKEVRAGWLEEQGEYFLRRVREFRRLRRAWSEAGQALIWTALALSVVGFLLSALPSTAGVLTRGRSVWLALGVAGVAMLAAWTLRTHEKASPGKTSPPPEKQRKPSGAGRPKTRTGPYSFSERLARWGKRGLEALAAVLGGVIPRLEGEHDDWRRFGARALAVATLTLLSTAASYYLGGGSLPPSAKLLGFCRTMSLSVGLLAGLWAATHFYTDNIRRYGEMGELFRAAHRRLGEHLQLFEDVLALDENLVDQDHRELAERARTDCQELLVDLGRETLYENSEWLSMHRNRPIEPVSA